MLKGAWRRTALLFSVAAVVALVAAACGGGEATPTPRPTPTPVPTATAVPATPTPQPTPTPAPPPEEVPKRGGIINYFLTRDPSTMDLNAQRSSANWGSVLPQMNWLVQLHQARGGPAPDLAQSWTTSGDGTEWTFNLVRNATWHDGQRVTVDDVIWTLRRITENVDGKVPAPPYKGSLAFITSMERPDDYTLKVKLSRPSASFLPMLGAIGNVIYPEHVPIEQFGEKKPVGSGPFKWDSWQAGNFVKLVRNPNYFKKDERGAQLPYLDGVTMFIIQDAQTGLAAFRSGKIDLTFPWDGFAVQGKEEQIKRDVPGAFVFTGGFGYHYITFRAGKAPWTDQRVRKAFQLAVDREAANLALEEGQGTPYVLLMPVGSRFGVPQERVKQLPGYNPATKEQDRAEARRLLAEAGVKPEDLKLSIPIRNIYTETGVVAIDQLNRLFDSKFELRVMDNATTQEVQREGRFDVYVSRNSGGLDDPSQTLDPFIRGGSGLNYGKWADPEVDRMLDEIDRTLDFERRKELAQKVDLEVYEQAWYVVLSSSPTPVAVSPKVKNLDFLHGQDGPPWRFEDVWLTEPK